MITLFFISLIITILFHEAAHLIVAKLVGCQVEIFSLGFGKPIFKKTVGNTIYQICPLVIGGFCKLKDELKYSRSPHAFTNLRYFHKVLISVAGVTVNMIMGVLCLIIGFKFNLLWLGYFGYISFILGITNILPIPALDGSYLFLVWLEKPFGKKKGYAIMERWCKTGFTILMILNILCIPLLIYTLAITKTLF